MSDPLLTVRNLSVAFDGAWAVERFDLSVAPGEVVGIVGESGSGKSVSMLALMGLVDAPGKVRADTVSFAGHELLAMSARERRRVVGKDIAMIFQDAQASLDPSFTIGYQIGEVLRKHLGLSGKALAQRTLELLEQVEIPDAARRLRAYPHQLSGGMNQRVMIAMAIACRPRLLIADEPTTALDVTTQAQIMALLRGLQRSEGMALVLISHDLAVVSEAADRVAVMYAGEVVEENRVPDIFEAPHHPYTAALLAAIPVAGTRGAAGRGELASSVQADGLDGADGWDRPGSMRLKALPGMVPGPFDRPSGCLFAPRCDYRVAACDAGRPPLAPVVGQFDRARCIKPLNGVRPTEDA
ncbi:MAG: ABC transporter ATP-binding protein [Janthinobacterium lividum]